jgi:hypothetical protein
VPVNGNSSWSSDGGDFGSPFSWIEESSNEDLDYFVVLDVATVESLPQPEVREGWCRSTMLVRCHEVGGIDGWGWNDPVFD